MEKLIDSTVTVPSSISIGHFSLYITILLRIISLVFFFGTDSFGMKMSTQSSNALEINVAKDQLDNTKEKKYASRIWKMENAQDLKIHFYFIFLPDY